MNEINEEAVRSLAAMKCRENSDSSTYDVAKQKRLAQRKIKKAIRKAVTEAFYAGYEAGSSYRH